MKKRQIEKNMGQHSERNFEEKRNLGMRQKECQKTRKIGYRLYTIRDKNDIV